MKVGVIGATGLVGTTMLKVLEPLHDLEIFAFASDKSQGKKIKFRNQELSVQVTKPQSMKLDYALLSVTGQELAEVGSRSCFATLNHETHAIS